MAERGWKSKGDKVSRRSPRKEERHVGGLLRHQRPVSDLEDSDVLLITTDVEANKDSQVQVITKTENQRDLQGRKGIKLLSE
jgi:hypothetical protein